MNKQTLKVTLAWISGILLACLVIVWGKHTTITSPTINVETPTANSVWSFINSARSMQRNDSFCALSEKPDTACLGETKPLCTKDMEMAKIAWKYFENNYNPATGFYNAVDNYQSTTMWDTGSALAATIAAYDFGFINEKTFDDRINAMLKSLNTMELFNKEAPNKAYHTIKGEMVDYRNNPSPEGIGISALDLARIVSWLNTLGCMHPKYAYAAKKTLERWNMKRLLADGQMYGLYRDPVSKEIQLAQEGRLGYEQYAGKIFQSLGYDQHIAAVYNNQFKESTTLYNVPIAYDRRDPRDLGAYNYVVTESYVLDAVENGLDAENTPLLANIYQVQKRRWEETGIVTAVSEDNIDQKPYFLYNTIFTAGLPWNTTTDKGVRYDNLKSVSTKAALALALLFPADPYSKQLVYAVNTAYDPERGWYSGIYENGMGYNKAITANTNGIIMSLLLYKKYGSFYPICKHCQRELTLAASVNKTCDVCPQK